MSKPRSSSASLSALKPPKAEEQAPSARSLINQCMSAMPYSSALGPLPYIKEDDSDEKALEKLANYLDALKTTLERVAERQREMDADLQDYGTILNAMQTLGKAFGFKA
jgi:hypothetical protein